MKRIIVSALIACATVFAQETVVTADTAAKVTDSAAQVVEPATPVTESAETASAEPATQTAEVVEPAASAEMAEPIAQTAVPVSQPAEGPVAESSATVFAASAPAPVNAPAAEKTWTHLWGVGATVPVEQYKSRGNKIDLINYGLDLSYTGVARFGLALHLSIAAGSSSTDNIRFEKNDDRLVGSFGAVEAGLGFSPVNTNGFTLVVLAVAGYEYAEFESDENEVRHSELGIVERRFTETMGALSVGGDLVLRFGLSEHIGIFASVGGRWLPITVTESSVRYEKDDDYVRTESYIEDNRGVYSVVPAIGAMWKF